MDLFLNLSTTSASNASNSKKSRSKSYNPPVASNALTLTIANDTNFNLIESSQGKSPVQLQQPLLSSVKGIFTELSDPENATPLPCYDDDSNIPCSFPKSHDDGELHEYSKEELIALVKNLQYENHRLKFMVNKENVVKNYIDLSKRNQDKDCDYQMSPTINFQSLGSTSVFLYKAVEDSKTATSQSDIAPQQLADVIPTDTDSVRRSYEELERGTGAFKAPEVADHRNLFRKLLVLEYEADSPSFRRKIEIMDQNVDELRNHLQLLVCKCREYCRIGHVSCEAGKDFSFLISALSDDSWFGRLGDLAILLSKFGDIFEEIESYREAVLLSLETTFSAPMEEFVKREVKEIKKLKTRVQQCSEDYELLLSKFLALKPDIDSEIIHQKEEELAMIKNKFELCRYDLVTELNSLETKKKLQLCERICSALYTNLGYFHQCHTLVATVEPAMRQLTAEVSLARKDFTRELMLRNAKRTQLQRELDRVKPSALNSQNAHGKIPSTSKTKSKIGRHISMAAKNTKESIRNSLYGSSHNNEEEKSTPLEASPQYVKAGYLWKKTTNFKKEWVRRWFFIHDGKFFYSRTDRSHLESQFMCDLVISTVKENADAEKRFTFEVISPGQRVYTLQGESQQDTQEWVRVIRSEIERLLAEVCTHDLHDEDDNLTIPKSAALFTPSVETIAEVKQANTTCADCTAENPDWVSLNLGIVICIECSGIHRSLGTHISKVRSLILDKWTKNTLQLLQRIGNTRSNSIWEELIISSEDKSNIICSNSSREVKENYIRRKYISKRYTRDIQLSSDEAGELLFKSSSIGDLQEMIKALANGANVNWKNPAEGQKSCLHAACFGGHVLAVELLCQWNALVDSIDGAGRSPLDYSPELNEDVVDSLVFKLERDLQQKLF